MRETEIAVTQHSSSLIVEIIPIAIVVVVLAGATKVCLR